MPLGPICCNQWQFGKQNFEDLFYADDVVLFLCLTRNDLELCNLLSEVFGHVTGLKTNLAKSSVIPIQCAEDDLRIIEETTDCAIKDFPSTYLGLPLTIRKPAKAELHPLIDKVADSLPGWKASLMTRVGRLTMVRTVFTAIPIYQMIALDLPKWVIRLLISEEGGFLWKGQEKANGGHCLVSRERVQKPLQHGGLGIHNHEILGWALHIRWLWQQNSDASWPWEGLSVNEPRNARALFKVAVQTYCWQWETTNFGLIGGCKAELLQRLYPIWSN